MEIDSDILDSGPHMVLERLARIGVPEECRTKPGLVEFVRADRSRTPELVTAILPTDREVAGELKESRERSRKFSVSSSVKKMFRESMEWLQWLMFEDDPVFCLRNLAKMNVGQRGVCGSVWGHNDIAYRCRTCENDPTCAICVPCFQNGDHSNHDYSIIYTGGGCCDCGDETAWKREGFCSMHKGAEQIQPLPENLANSVGPVLDAIFACWKNKLLSAESISQKDNRSIDNVVEIQKRPNELTFVTVEMLLEFCNCSESLLSFVSRRMISSDGLLNLLVKAEKYLHQEVLKKLHELLLKLIGDPNFKSEFAKTFVSYYPVVISEAVKQGSHNTFKKYPLVSTFSVQIFTVPTLTPLLVKDMNLLAMLFGCLGEIFLSCAGEDGVLQGTKWERMSEAIDRVIGDLKFVMSHTAVSKYATHEQQDLSRSWLILLTFAQGMNPQKRETGIHIEEENDYMHHFFLLGHSISVIHSLLVDGVYSAGINEEIEGEKTTKGEPDTDDGDRERHAKVGRLSHEDSVCSAMGSSSSSGDISMAAEVQSNDSFRALLPPHAIWLIRECLKVLETCLGDDEGISKFLCNLSTPRGGSISGRKGLGPKREISKVETGKIILSGLVSSNGDPSTGLPPLCGDIQSNLNLENASGPDEEVQTGFTADSWTFSCNSAVSIKNASEGLRILGLCEWPDIHYDVSTQPISVHLPLHRLLSVLVERALRICYGEFALPHVVSASYQDPHIDFFRYVLGDFHPYGFSAFIMEHALRIRVFCAQVIAGMWRRNGDTALVSCEWYRSVRWSELGLELDLFLLQCCGALAPADSYVSQILNRFGLSSYLSLCPDRSNEYEAVLVQEMLTLLVQILQERRYSGLTTAESLRREIIYKLATGDATHSQLVKSLPRDLAKSDKLQEILDSVSVYSNPSGFNQGKYSLRSSCWKELDLYHPRWHSRDLQAAEERYSRYCGVSALTTQLPRWRKIYPPLKELAKIGTCRTTLQIISTVLYYALYSSTSLESRAPDGVLVPALHLLSLSLDICIQQRECTQACGTEDLIPIIDLAGQETIGIDQRTGKQSLLSLLVSLMRARKGDDHHRITEAGSCNISSWVGSLLKKFYEIDSLCKNMLQKLAPEVVGHLPSPDKVISGSSSDEKRKAKARERQAAILAKMKAEQSKFLSTLSSSMEDDSSKSETETSNSVVENDSETVIHEVCSLCHDPNSKDPISCLIFLQKSKLLSFVDRGPLSWDRVAQSEKVPMGAAPDLFGMDVSSDNLSVGSQHLSQLSEDAITQSTKDSVLESLRARLMKNSQMQFRPSNAKGKDKHSLETLEITMYRTICRRLDDLKRGVPTRVEHQQPGPQSSTSSVSDDFLSTKTSRHPLLDKPRSVYASHAGFDGFHPTNCDGINLSSCGHAVHQGCLERYLTSLRERSVRRNVFEGAHIVDLDRGEFLCPVCRRLANSILPASLGDLCAVSKLQPSSSTSSNKTDEDNHHLRLPEALCLLQTTAEMIEDGDTVKAVLFQGDAQRRQDLEYVSSKLWNLYFSERQEKSREIPWVAQSIVMWDTLKYSLISMEIVARSGKTSMLPVYCGDSLYEEFKTSNGSILSLLLRVVQSTRTKNPIHVRQRFTGMQLFVESICSGISGSYSSSIYAREGTTLGLLKNANPAAFSADHLFWNRTSDPILSRDPFSSLMWVLFCLPSPCISCEESLLSLVHIFYTVSLVQSIIAYCTHNWYDFGLGFEESLKESGCGGQYFKSNYMDFSCGIKDTLRKCSFPFLRRCALLWRLLKSEPGQFLERDHMNVSSDSTIDKMDFTYSAHSELIEVQELEKMFKIPPIDIVLKDGLVQSLAQRWFQHFQREYNVNRTKGLLCITPAVPFRLMRLPHLYQDLLQRCIKESCTNCKKVIDEPALCLLCGRLCSPAWRPCCRESGCQTHAMSCGAGTGVFLLIRRTTILLQRSARQSPWPSPYLDAFGEEDLDMRRGKPLYLNEERYAALTYMVASHGLDQSTKVLAQTTIGAFTTIGPFAT
ncbi:PREDICTED: E3 ubiquitin-protein ligase PRT6 [Tarenaya hassleriana]|uniref:E3 ubiquitin-protein ligase PRT6 n=1 Tax=Tarenaya hassleriana TaxID=28532 RepID=UPI00053C354B|nr:PREDICTED: E3 ubiquitin-protein ligase PRT6 [Tarenaya hassleriana]